MEPAEDYRKRAAKAEAAAAEASDTAIKEQFLAIARQWRALAATGDAPFRQTKKPRP
jgi:hypothetical protein